MRGRQLDETTERDDPAATPAGDGGPSDTSTTDPEPDAAALGSADSPVMPAPPPFPSFENRPTLPHQGPGVGFESGRDSRAR